MAMILARPGTPGTTGPFFLDRVDLDGGDGVDVADATTCVVLAEALVTVGP
jgi:hypothetical protein